MGNRFRECLQGRRNNERGVARTVRQRNSFDAVAGGGWCGEGLRRCSTPSTPSSSPKPSLQQICSRLATPSPSSGPRSAVNRHGCASDYLFTNHEQKAREENQMQHAFSPGSHKKTCYIMLYTDLLIVKQVVCNGFHPFTLFLLFNRFSHIFIPIVGLSKKDAYFLTLRNITETKEERREMNLTHTDVSFLATIPSSLFLDVIYSPSDLTTVVWGGLSSDSVKLTTTDLRADVEVSISTSESATTVSSVSSVEHDDRRVADCSRPYMLMPEAVLNVMKKIQMTYLATQIMSFNRNSFCTSRFQQQLQLFLELILPRTKNGKEVRDKCA
ncbi:ABC-type phosphate transport system [Striga asiatica]|uniref:ABC-type phosphate transport system n=1 Tax=Striga asiatica TaxID=4170 RepID=A0A5A7QPB5_STRAF|nr:ABC-type phosphate transport system [Striga asiatica]